MMTCHDVIPCLLMFVNRFTLICIVKGHGKGRNDGIDKGGCAQNVMKPADTPQRSPQAAQSFSTQWQRGETCVGRPFEKMGVSSFQ